MGAHNCNPSVLTTNEERQKNSLEAYVPATLMYAAKNDKETLSNMVEGNDQHPGPLTSISLMTCTYLHTWAHRKMNSYHAHICIYVRTHIRNIVLF